MNALKIFAIAIVAVFTSSSILSAQEGNRFTITQHTTRAVPLILVDSGTGTSFIIDRSKKKYLITAKHIFPNLKKAGEQRKFALYIEGKLQRFYKPFFCSPDTTIDVVVIPFPEYDNSTNYLNSYPTGLEELGQECIFLGYPLGFHTKYNLEFIPLVKKAVISGFADNITLLDGHNNQGFSGGPVITTSKGNKEQYVTGIISGFYPEEIEYENLKARKKGEIFQTAENSGIMKIYGINTVVDIISIYHL